MSWDGAPWPEIAKEYIDYMASIGFAFALYSNGSYGWVRPKKVQEEES